MASDWIIFVVIYLAAVLELASTDDDIIIPAQCKDKMFCDIPPLNYPQLYFDEYITSMQSHDFMKTPQYFGEPYETIHHDDENCGTRVTIMRPFTIQSNNTKRLVVQTALFEQRIKQTECLTNGAPCFQSLLKLRHTATCSPTEGTVKLYLYNPDTHLIEHEAVAFPMCCTCGMNTIY